MTLAQAQALKPGDTVLVKPGKGNPVPATVIATEPYNNGNKMVDITLQFQRHGQTVIRKRLSNVVYLPAPNEF